MGSEQPDGAMQPPALRQPPLLVAQPLGRGAMAQLIPVQVMIPFHLGGQAGEPPTQCQPTGRWTGQT